jgi:amidase
MDTYEFMLIPSSQLFPFDAKLDWPHEIAGKKMQHYYDWMDALAQITVCASPSLNMPVGFNERGLPMGVQIVGRHQADFSCLQLAYAYEQATNWVETRRPPLLSA